MPLKSKHLLRIFNNKISVKAICGYCLIRANATVYLYLRTGVWRGRGGGTLDDVGEERGTS